MSSILSIQSAAEQDLKQRLKVSLGSLAAGIWTQRAKELFRTPTSAPGNILDKCLMAYLRSRALNTNAGSFFERLHKEFWQGDGGGVFASNCGHRFNDLFLRKQAVEFSVLQEHWSRREHDSIVEFGCSSGLLLNHLVTELGEVECAYGIDLNQSQIELNRRSPAFDRRIRFECEDAEEWLLRNQPRNSLFVTNGGVLEYFRRDRLDKIMALISNECAPALFLAIEPVAMDHDFDSSTDSIPFGEELSFSHNYRHLFECNGFHVLHQRPVIYDQWKFMSTLAKVD